MPRKESPPPKNSFPSLSSTRRQKQAVKDQLRNLKKEGSHDGRDRRSQIFYVAAQLFCQQGYDATSMSDIADAVGFTKAAIYHFIPGGKRDLLNAIIHYGMDTVQDAVIASAQGVEDAGQRLRIILTNHAKLVMHGSTAEGFNPVTVLVDEVASLSPSQRKKVNERKRAYMRLVRDTLEQLRKEGKVRDLDVTVVAFSLIGTIIWLGHWYKPGGRLSSDQVAETICNLALSGIGWAAVPSRAVPEPGAP